MIFLANKETDLINKKKILTVQIKILYKLGFILYMELEIVTL